MSLSNGTAAWRLAAVGALALLAGTWFGGSPRIDAQQEAGMARYEYTVVSLDALSLQAKLNELGNDGWELVAITTSEAKVDGANNPPKVITEKYDVTCRKVTRK